MPAQLLRMLRSEEVVCPAGELVGEADVRCRIVHETISGRHNPESVERFCTGIYENCTIWRQAREADLERQRELRDTLAREAQD